MTRLQVVCRLGLVWCAVSDSPAVRAQNRETLETKVVVEGTSVAVSWSRKHPWDADLIAQGASLYAEYRDSRGVVGTQCLQAPRGGAATAYGECFTGNPVFRREEREIQFQLPPTLTSEAAGPVCLLLRLPNNRVLPLRRANRQGDETARFQIEGWAVAAGGRKRVENLERRRAEVEASLAVQLKAVAEKERVDAGRGWGSDEACNAMTTPTLDITGSNRPVAKPEDQDGVARQVCTIRVANGDDFTRAIAAPTDFEPWLRRVPEELRTRWLTLRGGQVVQFIEDWKRYDPLRQAYVEQHRVPHFGSYADRLYLQSLGGVALQSAATALASDRLPEARDILGYLGAKVEAYDRCVTDGKRQLDLNYQESVALAKTLASMPERLREQEVRSCRAAVTKLSAMRAKVTEFRSELERIASDIANTKTASPPERRRELNDVRCTP